MELRPLRPHQSAALAGLRQSIAAGKRRPMLTLPTGSGKTVIGAHVVAGARAKGNRVTFCVPALSLVDQTFERFVENGIDPGDMGVIQASHPWRRPEAPVQIATAQTLSRREFPITDVVVIDEAHVRFKIYERWMADASGPKIFIGLSATPWAAGLGRQFDDLVKPVTMRELVAGGYLAPLRVFAPSAPDLSEVRTIAGEFHEGDLEDALNKPTLVADVVETWLARAEGRPTLCFAVGRAHAAALYERFEANGARAAYIDANTPREERDAIGRKLAAGEIQVVCNIGTLTTGIDWDVRCIIMARPTKSESLFVQILGRGMRPAPGKDFCLVLDHSDTHMRLGMAEDIDHALSMAKPEKAAQRGQKDIGLPLPRACPDCGSLASAGQKQCHCCGHEFKRGEGVLSVAGELVEFGKAGRSKPPKVSDTIAGLGKQAVWSQLLKVQLDRGWSDGRVAHSYRDIFGVWPRGLASEPTPPSPMLLSYLRSRAIAFAKSRAKAHA